MSNRCLLGLVLERGTTFRLIPFVIADAVDYIRDTESESSVELRRHHSHTLNSCTLYVSGFLQLSRNKCS